MLPIRAPAGVLILVFCIFFNASGRGATTPTAWESRNTAATLRVLQPDLLELELADALTPATPATAAAKPGWNVVTPADAVTMPAPKQFTVTVDGRSVGVRAVGLKRRAVSAPIDRTDLRVATWIYLQLEAPLADGAQVNVSAPELLARGNPPVGGRLDPGRVSPAIHVNQEGYAPDLPKRARVGLYLGSLGEMKVPEGAPFQIVTPAGDAVFNGKLTACPDRGFAYAPAPYQEVEEADFTAWRQPGRYRVRVAGLGVSPEFSIDEGLAMNFARAYALGLYEQRCGAENALPFTRFVHAACHVAPAAVPEPEADFVFTWRRLAELNAGKKDAAAPARFEPLYPYVRRGPVDVSGGHHDAGDYSKYTINSASFVHVLVFAVDSLAGVANLDNLGLPESGDGIPDLLQEAKWEADFLAKMQDDDGGFYFLVYPRDRPYEDNVLPDHGDPQVVWPKNTAATAAATAALAQAASSPRFRRAFPEAAKEYLEHARRGWKFLMDAQARHGAGAYQRLTHYGDLFEDRDELAWAAAELYLATGEREFDDRFHAWCDPASGATRRWGWWRLAESWGNAIRSYAFGARSGRVPASALDPRLLRKCEDEIEAAGRDAVQWSNDSAYGTSFPTPTKRVRGGGWYFSLDRAFDLAVASQLDFPPRADPRGSFLAAYVANLDYEAGCNPVNICFVTGLGDESPREIVSQYARNDRRVLPPSGFPVGNIQAGLPRLPRYQGELSALSFPSDGAAEAPYPLYDRWTDTYNVSTECVIVGQARALAGLAWLAARGPAARPPWRPAPASIAGVLAEVATGASLAARFVASPGLDLRDARITWEASGGRLGQGAEFSFPVEGGGPAWVEAEARWPDGRREFAALDFKVNDGRPGVTVHTVSAVASSADGRRGVFEFRRAGDVSQPLTVRFELKGDAAKWSEYRRPEGDMPVAITIPAGRRSAQMEIMAVAAGLRSNEKHLLLVLAPDDGYHVESPGSAEMTLRGRPRGR